MNNILTRDQWHDREQLINDIRGVFPIRIDASFENRTVFFPNLRYQALTQR